MELLTNLNFESLKLDKLILKNILNLTRAINSRQTASNSNEEQRSKKRKNNLKFIFESFLSGLINKNSFIEDEPKEDPEKPENKKIVTKDIKDIIIYLRREKTENL